MKSLNSFLLWCSGVNSKALENAKTAQTKYLCLGGSVLYTGALAYLSSFYTLIIIFRAGTMALVGAMIWALGIFNLDRLILTTMRRHASHWKEFSIALPRFLMAILFAYAFSAPLEMRMFQSEIAAEMTLRHNAAYEQAKIRIETDPAFTQEKQSLEAANRKLESDMMKAQDRTDQREAALTAEAEGSGGSMRAGIGPAYQDKKRQARQANADLQAVKADSLRQTAINQKRLSELAATQDRQLQLESQANGEANGFMAQYRALHSLTAKDGDVASISLFLTVFMIVLETAPLTVKLMTSRNPRNPYDNCLDAMEAQEESEGKIDAFTSECRVETEKARILTQQKTVIMQAEDNAALEQQLQADREAQYLFWEKESYSRTLEAMAQAKQKLGQQVAEVWLKHQEEKLRNDPAQFVDLI